VAATVASAPPTTIPAVLAGLAATTGPGTQGFWNSNTLYSTSSGSPSSTNPYLNGKTPGQSHVHTLSNDNR
jgi:hypothetical protein